MLPPLGRGLCGLLTNPWLDWAGHIMPYLVSVRGCVCGTIFSADHYCAEVLVLYYYYDLWQKKNTVQYPAQRILTDLFYCYVKPRNLYKFLVLNRYLPKVSEIIVQLKIFNFGDKRITGPPGRSVRSIYLLLLFQNLRRYLGRYLLYVVIVSSVLNS